MVVGLGKAVFGVVEHVGDVAQLLHAQVPARLPDGVEDVLPVGDVAVDLVGQRSGHAQPEHPHLGAADGRRAVVAERDVVEVGLRRALQDLQRPGPRHLEEEAPARQVLAHGVVRAPGQSVVDVGQQPAGVELVLGDTHHNTVHHDPALLIAHDPVAEAADGHVGEVVDEVLAEEALGVGTLDRVDG